MSIPVFKKLTKKTNGKIYEWEISQHVHSELFQMFIIRSGKGVLISGKNKIVISMGSDYDMLNMNLPLSLAYLLIHAVA